jgi:hypothetical protein
MGSNECDINANEMEWKVFCFSQAPGQQLARRDIKVLRRRVMVNGSHHVSIQSGISNGCARGDSDMDSYGLSEDKYLRQVFSKIVSLQ